MTELQAVRTFLEKMQIKALAHLGPREAQPDSLLILAGTPEFCEQLTR